MVHWKLAFTSLALLTAIASGHYSIGEPIPLSRCERNLPIVHIIPAAVFPSTHFLPIPLSADVKRTSRQTQPAVTNKFIINQHVGVGGSGGAGFSGGGGGGSGIDVRGFDSGDIELGGGFGGGKLHKFFARTYGEPEAMSYVTGLQHNPAMLPCPQNYILSCRPTLTPAPCSSATSASY